VKAFTGKVSNQFWIRKETYLCTKETNLQSIKSQALIWQDEEERYELSIITGVIFAEIDEFREKVGYLRRSG